MEKKNKLILLLTVIIFLIVITFLILINYMYGYTGNFTGKNSGSIDIFIIDDSNKDNNSKDPVKNSGSNNSSLIDKIIDFVTSPFDGDEEEVESLDVVIEPIVSTDEYGGFIQADSDIVWDSENDLRIFKNPLFKGKNILTPGSYNAYHFQIQNKTLNEVVYTLSFIEDNEYEIPIMYRIKKNDKYINKKWSYIRDINLESVKITSEEIDDYILEWKWFDSSRDTDLGYNSDNITYNLGLRLVGYSDYSFEDEEEKEKVEIDNEEGIDEQEVIE